MNLTYAISLMQYPDPNPGIAMYSEIIFPMLLALGLSSAVSAYQYIRYIKTFKLSLVPLVIWILSFIFLMI